MTGRRIGTIVALILGALLLWAYIDGGEEPLRPISEVVELPEDAR